MTPATDMRSQVRNGLLQRGLAPHIADAFVMNFQDESGLNPGINEIAPLVPGSRGGFGLYQLTGPRRRAYEAYAQQNGVPLDSVDAQLDFMMMELKGPESRAAKSIFAAQDTGTAAAAIVNDFLRPAEQHRARRVAKYTGAAPQRPATAPQGILSTQGPQVEAPPMEREKIGGLLGMLAPNMSADRADEMRLALNGMLHNPNQGRAQAIQARMGERANGRQQAQAQAAQAEQSNRTAQWLAGQPNGQRYAQAIAQGALPAGEALKMWRAESQGPEYRQVTGEQAAAMGLDPSRVYNVGADGKVSGIGGGDTNINLPGNETPPDATLRTELQKNQADTLTAFSQAGAKAASNMGDLQALRELSGLAPSGPVTGRLAQQFPEFNDVSAVRQSIVKRVAPQLRVEGSGSTSDIEYAGMIEGLGNLTNTPEANMAIADMMIAKAEIDLQRADMISQYQNGQLDYSALNEGLAELNRKSIMPESLRAILDTASQAEPQGGGEQAGQRLRYNPETGDFE